MTTLRFTATRHPDLTGALRRLWSSNIKPNCQTTLNFYTYGIQTRPSVAKSLHLIWTSHIRYHTSLHGRVDAVLLQSARWRRLGVTKLSVTLAESSVSSPFPWCFVAWPNVAKPQHSHHISHALPRTRRRSFVTFRTLTEAWCNKISTCYSGGVVC